MLDAETSTSLKNLRVRFITLGISRGLLFWYAIEKLFETHIGFSPEKIVLVGVIAQGSKVIFELPTSVVADRWSRRNILFLEQATMLVSCVVLGLSSSLTVYIAGMLVWSLSDALGSGVFEAFAYDTVRAAGQERYFKKIYARMKSVQYFSLAMAGVVAGVLSLYFSLRLSFFLSLASVAGCGFVLFQLPEPAVKRTTGSALGWFGHLGGAAKLMVSSALRWPIAIYIILMGLLSIWYEYYQLLGIDVKLSPVLFGSLLTVLTLGMVVGSELAHRLPGTRTTLAGMWLLLLLSLLLGLRFHTTWLVLANLFVIFVSLTMLNLYLEVYMHSVISSDRRATVFSLASTLGYACFFLLAALFSWSLKPLGIRGALSVASLPLLLLGVLDIAKRVPWATKKAVAEPFIEGMPER